MRGTRYAHAYQYMRLPIVLCGLVVALTLASSASAAPTLTVLPTVQRFYQDGTVPAQHPMPAGSQGLNFDDCNNNVKIRFTLSMTSIDTSNFSLQAFAGPSDCGPIAARTANTAVCWPVLGNNIAQASSSTVDINVRDIVSQIGRNGSGINLSYSSAPSTVCTGGSGAVSVYFLLVPAANGDATGQSSAFKVKLVGPPAPTVTSVGSGDGLLNVAWKPATDTDTQGFVVYTDPPINAVADAGGVTTCADAGFSDGGVDDAGNPINIPNDASCAFTPIAVSDGGACGTSALLGGVPGSSLSGFEAARTGNTTSNLSVKGLANLTTYNVAVAATDSYGNVGPISAPSTSSCGAPQPIDDFWKQYRQNGGTAGGSCAAANVGETDSAPLFGLCALGLAGVWMARRKSRMNDSRGRK